MAKKITSLVKIDVEDGNLYIKTVDKKSMRVIYFEGGFYVKPNKIKDNYIDEINDIKKQITLLTKRNIENNLFFQKEYRFFIDIADERIAFNKPSFLSFQLYVKPKDNIIENSKNFKDMAKRISDEKKILSIYKDIFEKNDFCVSKTKK